MQRVDLLDVPQVLRLAEQRADWMVDLWAVWAPPSADSMVPTLAASKGALSARSMAVLLGAALVCY